MGNVTSPESGEMLKQSSLEALGYICQEIDANVGLENDLTRLILWKRPKFTLTIGKEK